MAQTLLQPRVGFLNLPAEVKNCVYELALHSDPDFILGSISRTQFGKLYDSNRLSPNILATCHQVCNKASPVLYGSNTFEIPPNMMLQFCNQIGNNAKHVRYLILSRSIPSQYPLGILSLLRLQGLCSLKLYLGPIPFGSSFRSP
ncbi:uncharacterized protein MYCFIDRAFT_79272 [Pseudocercospora fijiensis CIRAD86]|uniref:F-box domain-containing protein n=1 Tax=Pseudocercospora fijiensis (strain CIRAD86) TaxID=383855 RepID=M3AKP1_PSEFD|nr:uncharacterized protein MYCFIDRAFT_79272 [Pseudocercospora fijiensis CIRAD86]EME78037.1 hypothetical protein MYCFIDRAFT_79272 [Pseudocercospora fijiensis CIRAD86]